MQGKNPVQIVLCTQNPVLQASFSAVISHWAVEQCVDVELHTAGMMPETGPDVLFLDVDGVAFPEPERPEALARTAIMAISARRERAIEAHRWHAAAFLPPQVSLNQLRRAMDSCFPSWRDGLQRIKLPTRRDRVSLPLCRLWYAEASGHETSLYCASGCIQVSIPIKKLEAELPSPPFFRCQKAFLVHLSSIADFSAGQLTMKGDGRQISVSRQQIAPLRQALKHWREEEKGCTSRL